MPKIIVTSRYMKSGSHSHIGNYVKYIATREGAAVAEKNIFSTKNQEQLIQKLLNDFPDSKNLPEYEKYSADKNSRNASECISAIIDDNMDLLASREIYMNYLGTRPNAVRIGSHGLFSETDEPINLAKAAREVAMHEGNVWTHVVSLRREDAERMGYNNLPVWRDLVKRHIDDIAAAQKIDRKNLKWYAAFHDKENNPHVHIVVYSQNPKEGFLTNVGIEKIRSVFANDIYRDELQNLYQKQTAVRDKLRSESDTLMKSLASELRDGNYSDPQLENLIQKLFVQLKNSKGKKQYGYLKPEVKKTVDAIVSCLAENTLIQKMYSEWCELEKEKYMTYTSAVKSFPSLAENKVFKPIKNCVINTVLNMNCTLDSPECEIDAADNDEIAVIDDAEPQEEVISESYFMKWSAEYKAARDILYIEKDTETALKLFKTEALKGNVLAMFEAGKIIEKDNAEQAARYYKSALDGFIFVEPQTEKMRPFVLYRIGKMYNYGLGTKQNFGKAFGWFEKAAVAENKYAQYSLGSLYYYGNGVEQNFEKTFSLYKKSADKGNAYGCYQAAKMLESGIGTEIDTELSAEYFKKAYSGFLLIEKNTNNADLQYRLGVMTLKGIGCDADIFKAAEFFIKSADNGNVYAAYRLGKIYLSDNLKNLELAEKYLKIAAEKDDPYAMYSLAKLYLGGEIPMRKDEAISLLEKSARLGNTVSSYALGKLYLFGHEIERDTDKAKEWLEISAAAGNEYAKNLLENMDKYNQSVVQSAAVSLLNSLGRMLYEDYSRNTHSRYITEHKLQNAIRRKKLALGIKDDQTVDREVKLLENQ